MKKMLLFHLLLVCPVVFLIWYIAFSDYLWLLEGNSFFAFTSDFADIQLSLPSDWAQYIGACLLQFFRFRMGGALVQTLFVAVVLLASDIIVARLTRNERLMWLSFVPVVWFMSGQFADTLLVRSVVWCAGAVGLALLVSLFTIRKAPAAWGERSFFSSPFFAYLVPCLLLGGATYREVTDTRQKETEFAAHIDRLAERRDWDSILRSVTPEMARKQSSLLRWMLLALSEKGALPERLFAYGPTEPSCFFYERMDQQFFRNFNVQFFRALELDNEVVHNAFQAAALSPYGNSFRSMRAIMEACMRQGQNRMLAKYVEVMKHTSCHTRLTKFYDEYLLSAGTEDGGDAPKASPFFIGAHTFLSDMARMADRYPENRKVVDYLLCGLLISKDMDTFHKVFSVLQKPSGVKLPRHYEEALLVLATKYPDILQHYPVAEKTVKDFNSFHALLKGGAMNRKMLEINYRDSFWLFYYCMKAVEKPGKK
ncbi:DUF6057 family protein [uncultured Bacteroides sp.]|uniref:DUF6057 family protein n=3 Tax=uncultured Bacteroides sp. TaxID=162156 RepID=UPI0025D0B8F2|nr:DUF6057 family protein [uncultured Bacteroides sp.]